MINVIITMAGLGSRFRKVGFTVPKYQIQTCGRTLFDWSMLSLKGIFPDQVKYIFLVHKDDCSKDFIESRSMALGIEDFSICQINERTDGQATSVLFAKPYIVQDAPIFVYNIDTYVEPPYLSIPFGDFDGFIPCFNAPGDHWSFVKLSAEGKATKVVEKTRISDNCTVGAYYFRSWDLYEATYKGFYANKQNTINGEKYIAPMYNEIIASGGLVRISLIPSEKVHVLGTPEELKIFEEKMRKY